MKEKSIYVFDAKKATDGCIQWIKEWFEKNCPDHKAILGLSGGKDSTIVAALLARAIGAENVIGVAMPTHGQGDNEAKEIAEYLGINYMYVPIGHCLDVFESMEVDIVENTVGVDVDNDFEWSERSMQNIPPRIRMTLLYAISQSFNGVPICTCNLSENFIGYSTIFGDDCGAIAPLANFTVAEVLQIGDELGLPHDWVYKTPDDGLPFSSPDEVKFGFTYHELDEYLRGNEIPSDEVLEKINKMHNSSKFKRDLLNIPSYKDYTYFSRKVIKVED